MKKVKCVLMSLLMMLGIYGFAYAQSYIDTMPQDHDGAKVAGLYVRVPSTSAPSGYQWKQVNADANGNIGVTASVVNSTPVATYVYDPNISSGTAGFICGVTSGTITIADTVYEYFFGIPSTNPSESGLVTPSYTGVTEHIWGTLPEDIYVKDPVAITFKYTIPITSTMTWRIGTTKLKP